MYRGRITNTWFKGMVSPVFKTCPSGGATLSGCGFVSEQQQLGVSASVEYTKCLCEMSLFIGSFSMRVSDGREYSASTCTTSVHTIDLVMLGSLNLLVSQYTCSETPLVRPP